ncbi:MAG: hypothetical protein ACLUHA_15310 [Bacteroides stercoris]
MQNSYLFRYNLLTDETEYRPANAADKTFVTIGKRELNTLCLEAHARGIPYVGTKISAVFFFSKHVRCLSSLHWPFILNSFAVWDGIDPDNPTGPALISVRTIILDKRFPYMDAPSVSLCPMDRTDQESMPSKRSSPTRQHPTRLPEIHILQKSDARQLVPLLFG